MTNKEAALQRLNALVDEIAALGFIPSEPVEKDYHYSCEVTSANEKAKLLVYFGKKGVSTQLQGKKGTLLHSELEKILATPGTPAGNAAAKSVLNEPEAYAGIDESGKGDFFGPLVIAGVAADAGGIQDLKALGVQDSKKLSDGRIRTLAADIKALKTIAWEVILIGPARYNELYRKFNNLNRLLAWGHAKTLENLLEKKDVATAISDKFGNERSVKDALQKKGKLIRLIQETKAERYTVVAAASILARQRFIDWLKKSAAELGADMPKGAGAPVNAAAKKIAAEFGREKLAELAKLHFKNYNSL